MVAKVALAAQCRVPRVQAAMQAMVLRAVLAETVVSRLGQASVVALALAVTVARETTVVPRPHSREAAAVTVPLVARVAMPAPPRMVVQQ
jgi:hypothetical protein